MADAVMATLHQANSFFEFSRPWELKLKQKSNGNKWSKEEYRPQTAPIVRSQCDENLIRLETIIAMTMDTLRVCGIALQPLLPQLAGRLLDKLNVPVKERQWPNASQHFVEIFKGNREPGLEVDLRNTNAVLFKRLIAPKENYDETLTIRQQCKERDQQPLKGKKRQKVEHPAKGEQKSMQLKKEQQLIKNRQAEMKEQLLFSKTRQSIEEN